MTNQPGTLKLHILKISGIPVVSSSIYFLRNHHLGSLLISTSVPSFRLYHHSIKMDHRGRGRVQYPRPGRGALRSRGYPRPAPATPAPPLGKFLASISHGILNNVKREEDRLARITNVQYLTSYNWLNKANLEILVPGESPIQWKYGRQPLTTV